MLNLPVLAPWLCAGVASALAGVLMMRLRKVQQKQAWVARELVAKSYNLWEREARLSNIINNAVDGLVAIDEHGMIEIFNPACERIFGYKAAEVKGQNVRMLMPGRYGDKHDSYIRNYQRTGEAKIIGSGREVEGRRKDGSEFPIDLSISEVIVGEKRFYSGIIRDISARRQAENEREQLIQQLVESNTQLEQFAYICSHDLQEPLRMILSYSQHLQQHLQGVLDEKGTRYMQFIADGAGRARTLINDVLALSRVGHEVGPLEDVSCEEVLSEILLMMQEKIVECSAAVTHDILPVVRAHRTYVSQVLQNLLANAIKFRGREVPSIHITAIRSGEWWQISVRDNGIGIAPQHQDKVFEIFKRLHGRGSYPGTGIGLAIVRKIIQQYQGKVWLESTPGEGTTFHFTLPSQGYPAAGLTA